MSSFGPIQPHPRRKPGPAKGDPRMVEAGRRGGKAVREQRGVEFFQAIGKKGGQATRDRYGSEFFSSIGRKGGEAVKQDLGIQHYSVIGRKGGRKPHDAARQS